MLLLFVLIGSTFATSQTLEIKNRDGTVDSIPIGRIRKITFDNITSVKDPRGQFGLIRSFILHQNYPNPFNPSTTIKYEMNKAGRVQIRIFDLAGKTVRTYASKYSEPGTNQFTWDARDDGGRVVSSGPYVYQLIVDGAIVTKKMLLIK
jgi:flagellar hook assembly protein FlgD